MLARFGLICRGPDRASPDTQGRLRFAPRALLAGLLAITTLSSCADERPRLSADTPVILVVVDTLRADRLSCYGCELTTSPNIDALANQSTLFSANATQANSTFPALTSILTGLYPRTHRNFFPVPVKGTATGGITGACLAERFMKRGYSTMAVTSHPAFADADPDAAMLHGWDRLSHISGDIPFEERSLWAHAAHTNERLFLLLEDYSAQNADQPLFLWAHYFDPHVDVYPLVYNAPPETRNLYLAHHLEQEGLPAWVEPLSDLEPIDRHLWIEEHVPREEQRGVTLANGRALYDAEITTCDAGIGLLFDRLREMDIFDRALILLLADHGENMGRARTMGRGDDGRSDLAFTHKRLYEGVSHTPLILKMPYQKEPVVCDALTQNIDVAPTLMELFDLPALPDVEGTSLVPLLVDPNDAIHDVVFTESSDVKEKSVKNLRHKYIDNLQSGASEFYDLREDPGEFTNRVAEAEPSVLAPLRLALTEFRPVDSMRLRLTPGPDPVALDLRLELERGRILRSVGTPEAVLSEDGRVLEWTVPVGSGGAELLLFPDQRRRGMVWRIAMNGAAPARGRVWIGKIPLESTTARPLYRRGPTDLSEGDPLPRLRLRRDGPAGVLGIEMRPEGHQSMEVELRLRRPIYGADFTLLMGQEFGAFSKDGPLSYSMAAQSSLPAIGLVNLGGASLDACWGLYRFDSQWPILETVCVDGRWAARDALEFAFPHPMDHRLAGSLVTGFHGDRVPPGSLVLWWESGGGGAEIDTSSLEPGLKAQLRALGYLR
jgi:arylsulfatase A-like enzyme